MLGARGAPARAPLPVPRPLAGRAGRRGRGARRRRLRRPGRARPARRRRRRRHLRVRERARRGGARASTPLPPPLALELGQDRLVEKQLFQRLGIPTARFGSLAETGLPGARQVAPARLRRQGPAPGRRADEPLGDARAGGGDRRVRPRAVDRRRPRAGRRDPLLAARRERAPRRHPPRLARARPPRRRRPRPRSSCGRLLDELGYVGVLALELFEVGGRLLANEFAPRVHNTGHWTIDGAVTSQFENHLRAILGLPLGSTERDRAVGDGEPDRRRARRSSELLAAARARTSISTARSRGRGASSATHARRRRRGHGRRGDRRCVEAAADG